MIRKIIISCIAATSLILFSTQAFALINFSVGVPLSHTMTGNDVSGNEIKSDGVSGYFVQVGVPILPGIGMDSYKTKIKCEGCNVELELETSMYNLYYLLPIPIINLTVGVGVGKTKFLCDGSDCTWQDGGNATQWYTSLGFPILPLFDLHLSYRSITTKIKYKNSSQEADLSGSVMGIGIMFNF